MFSNYIAKIRGIRKQRQEETIKGVINKRSVQIKSSDSVGIQKYFISHSEIFLLVGRLLLYSDMFYLQTVCKSPESTFCFVVEMLISVVTFFADISGMVEAGL